MRIDFSIHFYINLFDKREKTTTSWSRIKHIIKKRYNLVCQYCGQTDKNGHVDHIVPLSQGGNDAFNNLTWSCSKCNIRKGTMSAENFKDKLAKNETEGDQQDTNIRELLSSKLSDSKIAREVFGYANGRTIDRVATARREAEIEEHG